MGDIVTALRIRAAAKGPVNESNLNSVRVGTANNTGRFVVACLIAEYNHARLAPG
jgi:hypothetical protein